MKDIVILAPHVDDEVIGCFTWLGQDTRVKSVVYFFDTTEERKEEALEAGVALGYDVHFTDLGNLGALLYQMDDITTLLVPSRMDHHPHHRMVTTAALIYARLYDPKIEVMFYSVDMNVHMTMPLAAEVAENKRKWLYSLFPSQRSYFDQHPECYLFEDVRSSDTWNIDRFPLDLSSLKWSCDECGDLVFSSGSSNSIHIASISNSKPYFFDVPVPFPTKDNEEYHHLGNLGKTKRESMHRLADLILTSYQSIYPLYELRVTLNDYCVQTGLFPKV